MKRVFLITLLLAALLPQEGWACSPSMSIIPEVYEKQIAELRDKIYFVGLLEVTEALPEQNAVKVRLLQSYIKEQPDQKEVVVIKAGSGCGRGLPIPGRIYEEIIKHYSENEDKLFFADQRTFFFAYDLEELRNNLSEPAELTEFKKSCKNAGSILAFKEKDGNFTSYYECLQREQK